MYGGREFPRTGLSHAAIAPYGAQTANWSAANVEARLDAAGIPAAQVNEVADLVTHPQSGLDAAISGSVSRLR